jgi:hypothetical protein
MPQLHMIRRCNPIPRSCLVYKIFYKVFKIFRHIGSYDTYMKH